MGSFFLTLVCHAQDCTRMHPLKGKFKKIPGGPDPTSGRGDTPSPLDHFTPGVAGRAAKVPSILTLASPITKSWISPCLSSNLNWASESVSLWNLKFGDIFPVWTFPGLAFLSKINYVTRAVYSLIK